MIKINFIEPEDDYWKKWKADCEKKSRMLNKNSKIGDLYKKKEIKEKFFFNKNGPFHKKCVYCERFLQDHDDIDHFRPKNQVKDENNKEVMIEDSEGNLIPHHGYYWLAYDYRNLLPACSDCNHSYNPIENKPYGKGSRFPVKGKHAIKPVHIKDEEPLLINPVDQDPSEHFTLDVETGIMSWISEQGKMCINIFGLNDREVLVEGRKNINLHVKALLNLVINQKCPKAFLSLKKIKEGKVEFSFAGRKALEKYKDIYKTN